MDSEKSVFSNGTKLEARDVGKAGEIMIGHAQAEITEEYELNKQKKPISSGVEWIQKQNNAHHLLFAHYLK